VTQIVALVSADVHYTIIEIHENFPSATMKTFEVRALCPRFPKLIVSMAGPKRQIMKRAIFKVHPNGSLWKVQHMIEKAASTV
jgi:hypothetical protein